jgi:hypothetical protein
MPSRFELDSKRQRLITTVEGDIYLADVIDHLTKERQGQALGYLELVDATNAKPHFSPDDVRQIVAVLRSFSHQYKLGATAVVVPGDFAYGMMRMLGILVEEYCQVEAFRSVREAEAWLDQIQAKS